MNCEQIRPRGVLVAAVRVLLADDHVAMLAELRTLLEKDFEIVAAVSDGQQAVDAVHRFDPDVVILDISMPALDGLQTAGELNKAACRAKIIFLTIHEQREYIVAAFSAGASGYVTKRHLATDLIPAIHEVLQGRTFTSASLDR
jgi:DNA-binding NarL/FixJ family response regulator